MMFRKLLVSAVMFASAIAFGGGRTAVVGVGDCANRELISHLEQFEGVLQGRPGVDLIRASAALERLKLRPQLSFDEVTALVDAAQTQFYSVQHDKALEGARRALVEIDRLTPSRATWRVKASALVLEGMILRAQGKKTEALESFRRILRVQPDLKLDPDFYTPTTTAAFEAVRKELARVKRFPLAVREAAEGAEVFVDGAPSPALPALTHLPAGTYRVTTVRGGRASFVREVNVTGATDVTSDVGFEGQVQDSGPLCVDQLKPTLEPATKLGVALGADQVVLVRHESRNGEPGWLEATLVAVATGARQREGGLRSQEARKPGAVAELAEFILTGRKSAAVVSLVLDVPGSSEALTPTAAREQLDALALATSTRRGFGPRVASVALAGAGVGAGAAALAVYLSSLGGRERLSMLVSPSGALPNRPSAAYDEAVALVGATDTADTAGVALGTAGAALLVAGALVFFLLPPESPDEKPLASSN